MVAHSMKIPGLHFLQFQMQSLQSMLQSTECFTKMFYNFPTVESQDKDKVIVDQWLWQRELIQDPMSGGNHHLVGGGVSGCLYSLHIY